MAKFKELKPVPTRPEYWDRIEAELIRAIRSEIYLPLLRELRAPVKTLSNSSDDAYDEILEAISEGKIRFDHGRLIGSFTAGISRELMDLGAVWDRKGYWRFRLADMPVDLRGAIAVAETRFEQMAHRISKRLDEITPDQVAGQVRIDKIIDRAIWKADGDFRKSVKAITVMPELSEEQRRRLTAEYRDNMMLQITDWTKQETKSLRDKVAQTAFAGNRYESLVDHIRSSYGESQRKAKFLARQETSLLMTKIRQTRFEEAGVREYRWKCVSGSPAHPVRPRHLELDKTTHFWDNPPIVTEPGEPTRRCNPGQDFNCRCTAIPIVRFHD